MKEPDPARELVARLRRGLCAGETAPSTRRRITEATIELVGESGFGAVTVSGIIGRAEVSRRTFYRQFDSVRDCFLRVLDEGFERTCELIVGAFTRSDRWQDGVRGALAALLVEFDSRPLLARVWVIESLAAGTWASEKRERNLARLRTLVVEHWEFPDAPAPHSPEIVGAMAAVVGIIYSHLIARERGYLITLLGPMMGLLTRPHLTEGAVGEEVALAEEVTRLLLTGPYPIPVGNRHGHHPKIPPALRDPRAHRARSCLLFISDHEGVSNRRIASGLGIASRSQTSALLNRLEQLGLLAKDPGQPGFANVWTLSGEGERAVEALRASEL